jgi:DNA-binding NtrC family response regulator
VAKLGLLERAHGGTLFLDEVGELPLTIQSKLLRAVECRRITRLGGNREIEINVRFVTATNRDLGLSVRENQFRSDLLFRIGAATVRIPPLRDRLAEIPLLATMFASAASERLGRPELRLSTRAMAALEAYPFPGNVRELKNAIEFAVVVAEGLEIEKHDLPARIMGDEGVSSPVVERPFAPIADEIRDLIRRRILEALERHDGVQTHAAAALGMPLRTFTFRMRQYGIEPKR